MHIHILGICGTFMGGIAAIARAMGHRVTGSDANIYPPMSTQLEALGIPVFAARDLGQFDDQPDMVVIGNALSRGHPAVEHVLDRNLPYTSGPQWLLEAVLKDRWVLAVAGTHGKTTTSSMLAWVLEYAGLKPGYLIGGVPENFSQSARLGDSPFFVIEADEYDSAFFDKRSKFVHYRPRTLVLNNLEFDHADIFDDLKAIQTQFHHLLRMVPAVGRVISPANDAALNQTLAMGCWSERETTQTQWQATNPTADGSEFDVVFSGQRLGRLRWSLMGAHNVNNALMAIAAARHAGVAPEVAIEALGQFKNVKRRMEVKGRVNDITLYDDFAHHPTAIATTIKGLRARVGSARILAVLEPRSNTMKMGVHKDSLLQACEQADVLFMFDPGNMQWSMQDMLNGTGLTAELYDQHDALMDAIFAEARPGDHILIMSNGGFGGIHNKLLTKLEQRS